MISNNTYIIITFTFIILLLSFIGFNKLHIDTEGTNYFGKNSKIHYTHEFVNKYLAGSVIFHIVVEGHENLIKEPWILIELDKLKTYIENQENVDKVISITDLIKYLNYKVNNGDKKYRH